MKNLTLLIIFMTLLSSSCEDDLNKEFLGEFNGVDTEERMLTVGLQSDVTHPATINMAAAEDSEIKITLRLCHVTDGVIELDLAGVANDDDTFTIEDEIFLGKIEGQDISITSGSGEFITDTNIEIKFKEERTFQSPDPMNTDLEYTSNHTIILNQEGTGSPEC